MREKKMIQLQRKWVVSFWPNSYNARGNRGVLDSGLKLPVLQLPTNAHTVRQQDQLKWLDCCHSSGDLD